MPETGNNIADAVIDLIDETFDVSQSGSYHLSIETGLGGLSFCVFNTVINKYIVLRNYPLSATGGDAFISECRNIFENDNLLGLSYKSCSHLWISPRCTLVPEHLFDPANAAAYLNFNHGWKADEQVQHNYLRQAKLYNVFSCPKALIAFLQRYQPAMMFFHHATPFISSVADESLLSAKQRIAVYCYSDYMDIAVMKGKTLLFYNTFYISAPEDTIYYLAGVQNLFGVDLVSTKLFYAGSLKDIPPQVEIAGKYVDRMIECEPSGVVTYSHYMTEQLRRRFVHLFNLYGCVL